MPIEENYIIKTKATFSDDKNYRYVLSKMWDEKGEKLVAICLNPSKANGLKSDKTAMNLTNFAIDNNYGSIIILNLFAFMTTYPNELKNRNIQQERLNNGYIKQIIQDEKVKSVIIGWGSDNTKCIRRKREVEKLLTPYKEKLKCFKDDKGKTNRHPRDLTDKWILENYQFSFI